MVTDPQTHTNTRRPPVANTQTGPITIHCAAKLSAQKENRWFCRLLRINYKDKITNREIRERTKMIQLSSGIRRMRMKWTGHILRMSDNKPVKEVFRWEPSSRRSRERPKKHWMDCVEEDLHRAGTSRYGTTTGRQRVSLGK